MGGQGEKHFCIWDTKAMEPDLYVETGEIMLLDIMPKEPRTLETDEWSVNSQQGSQLSSILGMFIMAQHCGNW